MALSCEILNAYIVLVFISFGYTTDGFSFFDNNEFDEIATVSVTLLSASPGRQPRRSSRSIVNLPGQLTFGFAVGESKVVLNLHRNKQIEHDVPLYLLRKGNSVRKTLNHSKDVFGFYQDLNYGAAIMVRKPEKRAENYELMGTYYVQNKQYAIQPVNVENRADAKQAVNHTVARLNNNLDLRHDIIKISNLNSSNDSSSPTLEMTASRTKRQTTDTTYTVELLMVTDYAVFKQWYSMTKGFDEEDRRANTYDVIRQYYAFVLNGIDLRYAVLKDNGISIDVTFAGIVIVDDPVESYWTEENVNKTDLVDSSDALESFRAWILNNPNSLPPNDHVMLFTGFNLTYGGSTSNAGLAYLGSMCNPEFSMSIVEEYFEFRVIAIASHELAHSLGARHDMDGNSCFSFFLYIMTSRFRFPSKSKATNPWKFSSCSVSYFREYIDVLNRNETNCLLTKDSTADSVAIAGFLGDMPGEIYSPDEQCSLAVGNESYVCRERYSTGYSSICSQGLSCYIPGTTQGCTSIVPGDGTPCDSKRWCFAGKCEFSEAAPKLNKLCVMGDQPGPIVGTQNCSARVRIKPIDCYIKPFFLKCCASCTEVSTGIPGCEYGDQYNQCDAAKCPTYDKQFQTVNCCSTCYNYFNPSTTTTTTTTPAPTTPATSTQQPAADVTELGTQTTAAVTGDGSVTSSQNGIQATSIDVTTQVSLGPTTGSSFSRQPTAKVTSQIRPTLQPQPRVLPPYPYPPTWYVPPHRHPPNWDYLWPQRRFPDGRYVPVPPHIPNGGYLHPNPFIPNVPPPPQFSDERYIFPRLQYPNVGLYPAVPQFPNSGQPQFSNRGQVIPNSGHATIQPQFPNGGHQAPPPLYPPYGTIPPPLGYPNRHQGPFAGPVVGQPNQIPNTPNGGQMQPQYPPRGHLPPNPNVDFNSVPNSSQNPNVPNTGNSSKNHTSNSRSQNQPGLGTLPNQQQNPNRYNLPNAQPQRGRGSPQYPDNIFSQGYPYLQRNFRPPFNTNPWLLWSYPRYPTSRETQYPFPIPNVPHYFNNENYRPPQNPNLNRYPTSPQNPGSPNHMVVNQTGQNPQSYIPTGQPSAPSNPSGRHVPQFPNRGQIQQRGRTPNQRNDNGRHSQQNPWYPRRGMYPPYWNSRYGQFPLWPNARHVVSSVSNVRTGSYPYRFWYSQEANSGGISEEMRPWGYPRRRNDFRWNTYGAATQGGIETTQQLQPRHQQIETSLASNEVASVEDLQEGFGYAALSIDGTSDGQPQRISSRNTKAGVDTLNGEPQGISSRNTKADTSDGQPQRISSRNTKADTSDGQPQRISSRNTKADTSDGQPQRISSRNTKAGADTSNGESQGISSRNTKAGVDTSNGEPHGISSRNPKANDTKVISTMGDTSDSLSVTTVSLKPESKGDMGNQLHVTAKKVKISKYTSITKASRSILKPKGSHHQGSPIKVNFERKRVKKGDTDGKGSTKMLRKEAHLGMEHRHSHLNSDVLEEHSDDIDRELYTNMVDFIKSRMQFKELNHHVKKLDKTPLNMQRRWEMHNPTVVKSNKDTTNLGDMPSRNIKMASTDDDSSWIFNHILKSRIIDHFLGRNMARGYKRDSSMIPSRFFLDRNNRFQRRIDWLSHWHDSNESESDEEEAYPTIPSDGSDVTVSAHNTTISVANDTGSSNKTNDKDVPTNAEPQDRMHYPKDDKQTNYGVESKQAGVEDNSVMKHNGNGLENEHTGINQDTEFQKRGKAFKEKNMTKAFQPESKNVNPKDKDFNQTKPGTEQKNSVFEQKKNIYDQNTEVDGTSTRIENNPTFKQKTEFEGNTGFQQKKPGFDKNTETHGVETDYSYPGSQTYVLVKDVKDEGPWIFHTAVQPLSGIFGHLPRPPVGHPAEGPEREWELISRVNDVETKLKEQGQDSWKYHLDRQRYPPSGSETNQKNLEILANTFEAQTKQKPFSTETKTTTFVAQEINKNSRIEMRQKILGTEPKSETFGPEMKHRNLMSKRIMNNQNYAGDN